MNIYAELLFFGIVLTLSCLLEYVGRNDKEKIFGPQIDWISFWEDNQRFLENLTIFVHCLVGLSLWLLAKDTWLKYIFATIIIFSALYSIACCLLTLRRVIETGCEDEEGYVFQNDQGLLSVEYANFPIFASLVIVIGIFVHMALSPFL